MLRQMSISTIMKKIPYPYIISVILACLLTLGFCLFSMRSQLPISVESDYCPSYQCGHNNIQTYELDINSVSTAVDYGGRYIAQVCLDNPGIGEESLMLGCHDLDLTSIPDFKKASSNYFYFRLGSYSQYLDKAFFVYYVNTTRPSEQTYVYTEPHVLVSYDFVNHSVKKIGQIDLWGLAPNELRISPRGINALIVNKSPGSFWRGEDTSIFEGITVVNLQTGVTSRVMSFGKNEDFQFVTWIDDTHFMYKVSDGYNNGRAKLKIEEIKN